MNRKVLTACFMFFCVASAVAIQADSVNSATGPSLVGANPKAMPAQKAIIAAFDKYEVVGLSAGHHMKDLDDFLLALIRDPAFAAKVNDIVVECGNTLYQPILDRYIAGEDVSLEEVRPVWRNTTQPMCAVSAFYDQFFPLVRKINQKLPPGKKLRVLAGDPPIDWSKVKSEQDTAQFADRDGTTAAVMEKEVLSKHRKALMLFGTFHIFHNDRSALRYEKNYPGVTYIMWTHAGFGSGTPLAQYNDALEARLASWPVAGLAPIKGTWLGNLDTDYIFPPPTFFKRGPDGKMNALPPKTDKPKEKISDVVDAYLYLGPRDLLLSEPKTAATFLDKDFIAELQRRFGKAPPFITNQITPDKVREIDADPFFVTEAQIKPPAP